MARIFLFITLVFCAVLPASSVSAEANKPLPIDYWAIRDVVSTVDLSPDGKHLLVLKIESKEGENVLEIYKTSDLSKPFRRLNAKPMEFISAQWANDNQIFGTAWQVVRKRVRKPEEDVRSYKVYSYNLEKNKFSEAKGAFGLVNLLPNEKDEVLIQSGIPYDIENEIGVNPFNAYSARAYYRYNLETGVKKLVLKGNEKYPSASFDLDGNPRYSQNVMPGSNEIVTYYRQPGDKSWTEFGERHDMDSHENLYRVLSGIHGYYGAKQDDPSIGYIIDNRGSDKAALWEFNFETGQFGEKLFEAKDADVIGIQRHSHYWGGNNKLVAAIYPGAKYERHWFDMEEKALYERLEQSIPNSHSVTIRTRSRAGDSLVVFNQGPKDPGSFWFIQSGKMVKVGSRNPLVKPEDLSDVKYIRYTARDGLEIPAYVTVPKGEGPHPLIVLPHGGPHVNEVIRYDEWGQFLANNGYMVLQPQYRMSVGWGQKHLDLAYGQHGLTMQDDKDDGAQHLVDIGWADPNRIAMFGWSYGGYAALVAASREPNLYQCVIAGAAVADPEKVYLKRKQPGTPKALDDWSKRRGGYVGINPIKEVKKVNVPVMMVHGDWDARVMYFNYEDYLAEMEKVAEDRQGGSCEGSLEDTVCTTTLYRGRSSKSEDKVVTIPTSTSVGATTDASEDTDDNASSVKSSSYLAKNKFVTLKGADHFYRTLMYEHQKKLYTEMLDFLQHDCGPGGL